jgi:hypothetical protein
MKTAVQRAKSLGRFFRVALAAPAIALLVISLLLVFFILSEDDYERMWEILMGDGDMS